MRRMIAILACTLVGVSHAQADPTGKVFEFHQPAIGVTGPGPSPAYTEAIVQQQIDGTRPGPVYAGPGDHLFYATDTGTGVVVFQHPASRPAYGLSAGGTNAVVLYVKGGPRDNVRGLIPNPNASVDSWTAMAAGLPAPDQGWILQGHPPSPINAWVRQALALPAAE